MALILRASGDSYASPHTSSILEPLLRWLAPSASLETVDTVVFLVRKAAHVTEYAILAALLYRAFRHPSFSREREVAEGPGPVVSQAPSPAEGAPLEPPSSPTPADGTPADLSPAPSPPEPLLSPPHLSRRPAAHAARLALAVAFSWAALDEVRQALTATRTASFGDILLDTVAAAVILVALSGRRANPRSALSKPLTT